MATVLVGAAVAAVLGLAVWSVARDRKRGRCAGCASEGRCDKCK